MNEKPAKRTRKRPSVSKSQHPPEVVVDDLDPGDEMQYRLEYQYGYGVVLLASAHCGKLPYTHVWCEQHDDYLCQHGNLYDSHQVKTREDDQGPWELNDQGLISAISKFGTLKARFPASMKAFHFVSNARCLDTTSDAKLGRSPIRLLKEVRAAKCAADLGRPYDDSLKALAEASQHDKDHLFATLQSTHIVQGPPLNDFHASLSMTHLAPVPECRGFSAANLNRLRDGLMTLIRDASCRKTLDPAKHWYCLLGSTPDDDPYLKSKKISVAALADLIAESRGLSFRFAPLDTPMLERISSNALTTLEEKLIKAGLAGALDTMRRRTVSAEMHLLELAASRPDEIDEIRNQLEAVVQGVCDDAALHCRHDAEVGPAMLTQVQQTLRAEATNQPTLVANQSYDCLVGIAGLLTEACTVWWGKPFTLNGGLQ